MAPSPATPALLSSVAAQVAIALDNAFAYQEIQALKDKLAEEKLYLQEEIERDFGLEIVGRSPSLQRVLRQVETVAPSDATVLILGETGTGKELMARAIHERSRRKDRGFVQINCASIPAGLVESELFGYEKGAFTGALSQKMGRLELAHQGTLFLDEIGDLPLELQPKLLRAIQEREFERLGSTRTQKVDLRLITATNRDLAAMVRERQPSAPTSTTASTSSPSTCRPCASAGRTSRRWCATSPRSSPRACAGPSTASPPGPWRPSRPGTGPATSGNWRTSSSAR